MTGSELENQNDGEAVEATLTIEEEGEIEDAKERLTWAVFLMVMIAITSWATPNVIGRYLAQSSNLSPTQISVLRYAPAAIIMLTICLLTKRGKQLFIDFKKCFLHFFVASIFLDGLVLFQMFSVVYTTASASAFLLNVNPVFAYVLAIVILKERHRWWGVFGVLFSLGGIFLIAVPFEELSSIFSSSAIFGNILGLLSGVSWALYTVYLKKFLKERDPMTTTTWNLILSSITLIIAMFIVDGWFTFIPSTEAFLLTSFLGVVATAIAFTLWFESLKRASVQKISAFQFLIPIIATVLAVIFLHEKIDYLFGIGGGLIIIGLFITQMS